MIAMTDVSDCRTMLDGSHRKCFVLHILVTKVVQKKTHAKSNTCIDDDDKMQELSCFSVT